MNTLYVVASSAQQRPLRLPAAQLYIDPVFSAAITHARRFAKREQDVRVLSLKHGLLSQGHLLEPYNFDVMQLGRNERAQLIRGIRRELPHRGVLPLRIVVLAPDEYAELFREACVSTLLEKVPMRTPLSKLNHAQQIQWLQAATWVIECYATLPLLKNLDARENEQLSVAVRAAAIWWSQRLMSELPPPEASVFAGTLALELHHKWEEVASESRGEWPEDIRFSVQFREQEGPIVAALTAIGLSPRDWWKREGHVRPVEDVMIFSMASVSIQSSDQNQRTVIVGAS